MPKIWQLFPELTRKVKEEHDNVFGLGYGHDFDHALRVGNLAYQFVVRENKSEAKLAGLAGLCHNADHILQVRWGIGNDKIQPAEIRDFVYGFFTPWTSISDEMMLIAVLCLKHGEPNRSEDRLALIALKDADRVVNAGADVIMRNGQFFPPDYPVVDPIHLFSDSTANFRNAKSVFRGLQSALDWEDEKCCAVIRLPQAKKLARRRFAYLRKYVEEVIEQRREEGLLDGDYPVFQ